MNCPSYRISSSSCNRAPAACTAASMLLARDAAAAPSNTHGPASFRGVMGPSWPLVTGAPVGEGVLVSRRESEGIRWAVEGMGIGLDTVYDETTG
jgi:hypothetical protein